MKKLAFIFSALVATCGISHAATLPPSMSKDQVQKAFANKTITAVSITFQNGQDILEKVKVAFDDQGNVQGKFEHKPADAKVTRFDTGKYAIKDDGTLCFTWQHWHEGNDFCVTVYDMANAYLIVNDNDTFHTFFMKDVIKEGKQLK